MTEFEDELKKQSLLKLYKESTTSTKFIIIFLIIFVLVILFLSFDATFATDNTSSEIQNSIQTSEPLF